MSNVQKKVFLARVNYIRSLYFLKKVFQKIRGGLTKIEILRKLRDSISIN